MGCLNPATVLEQSQPKFVAGVPTWPVGRARDMNDFIGFRTDLDIPAGAASGFLRVTASSVYRAFLDGEFLAYGPARAAHNYYRVDEIRLPLSPGRHTLAIEVAGYNVNSFYTLDQPSFLQAEFLADGQVLAATGPTGNFQAIDLMYRVRKVCRYSFQRPFTEVYRLLPESQSWRTGPLSRPPLPLEPRPAVQLLPRRVPYLDYECHAAARHYANGPVECNVPVPQLRRDRSLINISDLLKGFPVDQLELIQADELQQMRGTLTPLADSYNPAVPIELAPLRCHALDFAQNYSGFLRARITAKTTTRLFVTFDEVPLDGISGYRADFVNALVYELAPGEYDLESFEPYTLRYVKFTTTAGHCEIRDVALREYAAPQPPASFACADFQLNRIYDAAIQTLRQNATDLFMDCPSRERAGWLCDSFFTARAAFDVYGHARTEAAFLENFLLAGRVPNIDEDMLPCCYPAEFLNGLIIPQWSLWLVLQLEEYQQRTGDRSMIEAFAPKLDRLLRWLDQFTNADGLLEKLPGWNFIEWSFANQCAQDVNYPSNMLFAGALEVMARLYQRSELSARAARIRAQILQQSWDGEFFVDNALRQPDGSLQTTRHRTEVCQYYAFFFNLATPDSHPELWRRLTVDFGPQRAQTKAFPEIHPANAFIGNYMRLDLLSRYGRSAQVTREISGYFYEMARQTGTLWEHMLPQASCCHGFAAHVLHWLRRDVLGVAEIDLTQQTIRLTNPDSGVPWSQACIPIAGQNLYLTRSPEKELTYSAPAGFHVIQC